MFPIRPRRASTALIAAACAVVLTGILVSDAAAGHRKWKGRGHRSHDSRGAVVRIVERPVYRPQVSFAWRRLPPTWCHDDARFVHAGNPYWYHVGLGAYFGGVDLNVDVGNTPPQGYGYWDPECGEWCDDVRAYSTHCKRHHHRPALQVIRYDADHSQRCGCDRCDYDDEEDDDDDHEQDWR